jgi:tight adherence protein B
MTSIVLGALAAGGVFLLCTPPGAGVPRSVTPALRSRATRWLVQAGLDTVRPAEFAAVMAALAVAGGAAAYALFGGWAPSAVAAGLSALAPVAMYRSRHHARRADLTAAWPRLIEEMRVRTSSLGRSVPQALFEVGRHGPADLRPAFAAAEREWLLSTDFERTAGLLKARLADATADAALETLLVAHELGGTDLERRLAALVEDRVQDVQGRKDAAARQAGVRFARRFVLLVPAGMALAGLSIGTGRAAYATATGQMAVVAGLLAIAGCWSWAGRLLRLPDEERVFDA